MSAVWHYADGSQSVGPLVVEELLEKLPRLQGERTLVFGPGLTQWAEARTVPELASRLSAPPPPVKQTPENLNYEVTGNEQQYVTVTLAPQEKVVAEAGAMMFMTAGVQMETSLGDKNKTFLDNALAAGKRAVSGESLFFVEYTNRSNRPEEVAFAAPYPGKIVGLDLKTLGGEIICQKSSFLCATAQTRFDIAFQRNIAAGLFGGEGFILQRLRGQGIALIHAGGTVVERTLGANDLIRLDTGCLVAMSPSVQYDVEMASDIKNAVFGGEGLFLATLRGPGKVWLQSLPFSRLAVRVLSASIGRGRGREEGSVLGPIGSILLGDRRF